MKHFSYSDQDEDSYGMVMDEVRKKYASFNLTTRNRYLSDTVRINLAGAGSLSYIYEILYYFMINNTIFYIFGILGILMIILVRIGHLVRLRESLKTESYDFTHFDPLTGRFEQYSPQMKRNSPQRKNSFVESSMVQGIDSDDSDDEYEESVFL